MQNNTDVLIADQLIEKGIRQQDIVLGFLPVEIRQQLSTT
ncbi:MAG: element excision factor XisI family protein [Bacteroidia bacterium]